MKKKKVYISYDKAGIGKAWTYRKRIWFLFLGVVAVDVYKMEVT